MHANYTATKGIKILGTEVFVGLSDSVNNDTQQIVERATEWTKVVGAGGGSITITDSLITITQGASAVSMYTHAPITCVVSDIYSVSFYLPVIGVGQTIDIGIGDTGSDGVFDRTSLTVTDSGLHTLAFTATSIAHYVIFKTSSTINVTTTLRNECEKRTAEIITSAELHDYSNAAADPNGTEVNAITGFAADGTPNLTTTTTSHTGTRSIRCETNTTPEANAGFSMDFDNASIGLVDGIRYVISFYTRHDSAGGRWDIVYGGTGYQTTNTKIVSLTNVDTTFTGYIADFIHSTALTQYLASFEKNGSNDGGVMFDNFSLRRAEQDISTTGVGIQVFGTVHKVVSNVNSDTYLYSNWSTSNFLKQPFNSALNSSTGDFYVEGWFRIPTVSATSPIYQRGYYSGSYSGSQVYVFITSAGLLHFQITDDAYVSEDNISSTSTYDDNEIHYFVLAKRSNVLSMFVDKEKAATDVTMASALGDMDNPLAETFAGTNVRQLTGFSGGYIAAIKVGVGTITDANIAATYNLELPLFQRDSVYTQVSTNYSVDMGLSAASKPQSSIRSQEFSLGGNPETILTRREKMWEVITDHVTKWKLKYIEWFIDAVMDGQTYNLDVYGRSDSPSDPKSVTQESNSTTPARANQSEYFKVSFKARER